MRLKNDFLPKFEILKSIYFKIFLTYYYDINLTTVETTNKRLEKITKSAGEGYGKNNDRSNKEGQCEK